MCVRESVCVRVCVSVCLCVSSFTVEGPSSCLICVGCGVIGMSLLQLLVGV